MDKEGAVGALRYSSSGSSRLGMSTVAQETNAPCKMLTLVVQLPYFFQLELAQRRPPTEEDGKALVTSVARFP